MVVAVASPMLLLAQNDPSIAAKTDEAQQLSARFYLACLTRAARLVDDHTSDAATIAKALDGSCQPEFSDYMTAVALGSPGGVGQEVRDQLSQRYALSAVLLERRIARKNSN